MSKTLTFKTPKGTELPMLDLRGKPYLQVAHRLVWFREEHADWAIDTEIVEQDATHAIIRATIRRPERGELVATAVKREDKVSFPDFLEKAETGAVGRALAMCGYGTQFAPELDEGDRLADSPIQPAKRDYAIKKSASTEKPTVKNPDVPLSHAQKAMIQSICKDKNFDAPDNLEQLTKGQASKLIDRMMNTPARGKDAPATEQPVAEDVPVDTSDDEQGVPVDEIPF